MTKSRGRVAAIDCGTNSIRLLIADVDPNGCLNEVERRMRIVRLGQGVDAGGEFIPEAIERTRAALRGYVKLIGEARAGKVRMVATSAARDVGNCDRFFDMTADELATVAPGIRAEVITGDEEARLSFAGAIGDLDVAAGPFLVVDLGGGSTELVLGDENGVRSAHSADVGCVRVTERCLPGDPPTDEDVLAAREFVRVQLAGAFDRVPVEDTQTWVGVAGTMTTLSALAQGLNEYDPELVHLSRLSNDDLDIICGRLIGMTRDERAALGPMHPGRVDVIAGGAIIAEILAEELRRRAGVAELVVSEHDILDGIALSLV